MSGVPRKRSPVTPPGIDPGTVRLVAQRLNHYATTGPHITYYSVCTYLQINITQKVMIRKKRTLLNTHNISRDKERMRVSSYIPSPHTHTHTQRLAAMTVKKITDNGVRDNRSLLYT